jgi:hypothetical protein
MLRSQSNMKLTMSIRNRTYQLKDFVDFGGFLPFNSLGLFPSTLNLHVGGRSWRNPSNFASSTPGRTIPVLFGVHNRFPGKVQPIERWGRKESHRSQVISSAPCSHCYAAQEIGEGTAGGLKGEVTIIFLTPLSVTAERGRLLSIGKNQNFLIQAPTVIGNLNFCNGYTLQRMVRRYERTD